MNDNHILKIAKELNTSPQQVRATAELLDQDATVPFIARYRKEATGSLDEVAIMSIRDRLEQLGELDKRREAILQSLTERELLTDELNEKIQSAEAMAELEDIYLPFRPKRRTRATIAKEKGLEPLALVLMLQNPKTDPLSEAEAFVSKEKGVASAEDALAGARDIIAEMASEDADVRSRMRELFASQGIISSSVVKDKDEEGAKFRDYFDWSERVTSTPSHRVLAMFRGEKEGFLKLHITPPEESAEGILQRIFIKGSGPASEQVELALQDGYKRLLAPSMETEIRAELKQRADTEAIRVFSENLRELLLSPPLGGKRTLAIDPGFRTGCKVVCLDSQGKLLYNETIYPHTGGQKADEAGKRLRDMCERFKIEVIAIGNGTASRETETFVRAQNLPGEIQVVMVNEAGASIYSASEAARDEFPDYDITVRGAVSIGRRLMDPLAELVKIDPKSIGVGQYQHDVDQNALKRSLDDVVESSVNRVGVDVNTASKQLLTYVSGLGPKLAQNIVDYRNENGPFISRQQLKKVKGLGPKAFEQAAGFLRIRNGDNPLDASAVHPESYGIVDRMSKDLGCKIQDLMRDDSLRKQIKLKDYVSEKVGLPTLRDIMDELAKPGRDPREKFEVFQFAEGIEKMEDLHVGMRLPGIVTNVTAFGAFVDIGVHQDGLVHISQLADRFVKDPAEVVKVHQKVEVVVTGVDIPRKRVSLSMKKDALASSQGQG
ncbi:MAG: Tex family protein [Armatimonadota bacterium]